MKTLIIQKDILNLAFNNLLLISESIKTFDSIDKLLFGDLNLEVTTLESSSLIINNDGSILSNDIENDLIILDRIASMGDSEHIKLFNKHGLFHDGGDDFDYSGSYISLLIDVIKEAQKIMELK